MINLSDSVKNTTFRHREPGATELHAHTTASDGTLTPKELVELVHSTGIRTLAITDHDTLEGYHVAKARSEELGITLVPGIELSVDVHGTAVHLLAYGFDPQAKGITDFLSGYQADRAKRAKEIVERLQRAGFAIDLARVHARAKGVIGRPHIADELIDVGVAVDRRDAFLRFLGDESSFVASIPPRPARQAIRTVHEAGGVTMLAHPGHGMPHRAVLSLLASGLDGLEAYHPSHDEMLEEYYQNLALSRGLLVSGGSDFHGYRERDASRLGCYSPPEPQMQRLRERLRINRQ